MVNEWIEGYPQTVASMAAMVDDHPDYRVLRRFKQRPAYNAAPPGTVLHHGVFVDVETTGLDPEIAEVIEFGGARFTFDDFGTIYTVGPTFDAYEQPETPILPEITALTGITNDMVKDKIIPSEDMSLFMKGIELTIAHNADYDRKIIEKRWPFLKVEPGAWACSQKQIDWKARGAIGAKLGNILMTVRGMFYDAHRALDDCLVGIDVLNHQRLVHPGGLTDLAPGDPPGPLQPLYQTALGELLDTTRTGVFRLYAHEAPFEMKDRLKARGFFWTGQKPWKRDFVTIEAAEEERAWLDARKIGFRPQIKRISARHRYSEREEVRAVAV